MSETRTAILTEAEALIRARGYSGVSYGTLAERIGIRKASIHHHFPNKIDLARALLVAYDARYDEALAGILEQSTDGLQRVRAYATLYLQGVDKGLGCLCAAFAAELDTLPVALKQDLDLFFAKHVAWVERVLTEGRLNASIRASVKPGPYARMIVSSLEGALMMERTLGGANGFVTSFSAIEDVLRPWWP